MRHRFYAPDGLRQGGMVSLPPDEADHLRRVLRLRVGDEVGVFDGRGAEYAAHISSIEGSRVTVTVLAPIAPAHETQTRITLAQSVLKGDKMDEVVRDSVMLGVSAIQPLISTRTDVPLAAAAGRVDRWTRIAMASTKQCGRAQLARVAPPCTVDEWLRLPRAAVTMMMVEPDVERAGVRRLHDVSPVTPESASVLVGPEGGWTADEIDRISTAGAMLVTLGARTLRADAAPLVLLSMLLYAWDEN